MELWRIGVVEGAGAVLVGEVPVGEVSGGAPEVEVDGLGIVEDDNPEIGVETGVDDGVDDDVDDGVEVGTEELKHEAAGVPTRVGIETKQG